MNYAYTQLRDGWVITDWKKEILYFLIDWLSGDTEMKSTTSGSTGKPKTISIDKGFVKNSAHATCDFFNLKKGDTAFLCLPVKYIAGKLMLVRAIERKLNLYCVEPGLTPAFEEAEIDFAAMTPTQVILLLEDEKGRDLLERVKSLLIGGDAILPLLEEKLQGLSTNVWHSYGMTETITHIALRKVNGPDATPGFTPLPNVSVSVNSNKCLVIDAPDIDVHHMETNDIAELFEDGSFIIKGRKDNVVISGGVKLFPEEIEKQLVGICEKPFYLTGVKDERLGKRLIMVVESDGEVDKRLLLDKIRVVVRKLWVPKEIVLVKKFQRTISGKIIRRALFL